MAIGKSRKKLTYCNFFVKRLTLMLLIALLVGAAGLFAAGTYASVNASTMNMYEFAATKAAILDSHFANGNQKSMEYYATLYSDYQAAQYTGTESAMVITEKDTGKIVATSEFAVYALFRENDSADTSVYICRDENVVDFYIRNNGTDVYFDFDKIYINGDTFIPAEVTAKSFDMETLDDRKIIAQEDFTPADTTGYTLYDGKLLTIQGGTLKDSELLVAIKNAVDGKSFSDAVHAIDETYFARGNIDFINYDEFEYCDKEYAIFSIGVFDFWKLYGVAVICGAINLLVLAVSAAAVIAFVSYSRYSSAYDADEFRRSMIDALSHDLKTPLMAISGYAENLQSGAHPDKADYYTTAILENTSYMNDVISGVLELTKLEDTYSITKESVDVMATISELYEKYRPAAEAREISFTATGSCIIQADRKLMTQALENLIANAVKYTVDGGKITVVADGKYIELTNDCDKSLSLNNKQLCTPMSKGDSSRKKNSGTGMGLSIVDRICRLHRFSFEAKATDGIFSAEIRL